MAKRVQATQQGQIESTSARRWRSWPCRRSRSHHGPDGRDRRGRLLASRAAPGDPAEVLAAAAAAMGRGVSGAMATVLERHGSAPGTPGQKLFLAGDGTTCLGTVGGGAVEREVLGRSLARARP